MRTASLISVAALLWLTGCNEVPVEEAEVLPRPVLYMVAEPQAFIDQGFTGTVEPRFSTDLAFRVLGNLTARAVNVGDLVRHGEVVASIDPSALDLNVQSARAALASAEAQLASAAASEERNAALLKSGNIAQANYDAVRQMRDSAAAGLEKAQADYRKALDQRDFAQLQSDFDGVVSAVYAEVGQVVSAGQPVLQVARSDIRDVVVDVPDTMRDLLKLDTKFDVFLQADPQMRAVAQVREVAPVSDAFTRSRRLRLALDSTKADFRLGATVRVIAQSGHGVATVLNPASILQRDDKKFVWIVDPASETVHLREVRISGTTNAGLLVNDLDEGTIIVTAGIHQLSEGQKVRLGAKGDRN